MYKALRTSDGPICAYDRDFAYVHSYDHVLYHSPAYSHDMNMEGKLRYVGAKRADFWPLGLFDAAFDATVSEEALFGRERDIDVIFIGAQHVGKMPFLAKVKKTLGSRCRIYGLTTFKRNVYFNVRYDFPAWVHKIPADHYIPLYQKWPRKFEQRYKWKLRAQCWADVGLARRSFRWSRNQRGAPAARILQHSRHG